MGEPERPTPRSKGQNCHLEERPATEPRPGQASQHERSRAPPPSRPQTRSCSSRSSKVGSRPIARLAQVLQKQRDSQLVSPATPCWVV